MKFRLSNNHSHAVEFRAANPSTLQREIVDTLISIRTTPLPEMVPLPPNRAARVGTCHICSRQIDIGDPLVCPRGGPSRWVHAGCVPPTQTPVTRHVEDFFLHVEAGPGYWLRPIINGQQTFVRVGEPVSAPCEPRVAGIYGAEKLLDVGPGGWQPERIFRAAVAAVKSHNVLRGFICDVVDLVKK